MPEQSHSPNDDAWVPDMRTLQWAMDQVKAADLEQAIARDVPLRVKLLAPLPEEVCAAAGDAAYEATWWPLLRTAKRLSEPAKPTAKTTGDGADLALPNDTNPDL